MAPALLLSLTVATALVGGAEAYWRSFGHRPSVVDDPDLWAYHRGQVYHQGSKAVAVVGASRIQLAFATSVFRRKFPDHHVVQLAIDGRYPIATLRDLAQDERFTGLVVCAIDPNGLMRQNFAGQQEYVDYYHHKSTLNNRLNKVIGCAMQERLVVLNPQANLKNIFVRLLRGYPMPGPLYLITGFDRSRAADYGRVADLESLRQRYLRGGTGTSATGSRQPAEREPWLDQALALEPYVKQIQARGGDVVFIQMPTSGELRKRGQQRFPRDAYWDPFAGRTAAAAVHFEDVPSLAQFDCPDLSHLDFRDRDAFTTSLLDELTKRGILPRNR